MSRYVVDANVVAKWFIPEEYADMALRLLNESHELLAPDYVLAELGNILWKKIMLGDISQAEAQSILPAFRLLSVQLHPIESRLGQALEMAANFQRSIYDCFYLTLAVEYQCQMITADRKFYNALQSSSLAAHLCWIEDLP
ncbi:MAG: type II toxin-antitoxin system VapC family toxin [Hormoscilla sp. SP12CHS1]|nr:type II toxin-antitoxin system VapC family toxin [Hormoscilla sp. SP12CHS1]